MYCFVAPGAPCSAPTTKSSCAVTASFFYSTCRKANSASELNSPAVFPQELVQSVPFKCRARRNAITRAPVAPTPITRTTQACRPPSFFDLHVATSFVTTKSTRAVSSLFQTPVPAPKRSRFPKPQSQVNAIQQNRSPLFVSSMPPKSSLNRRYR